MTYSFRRFAAAPALGLVAVLVLSGAPPAAAQDAPFEPVTDAMLLDPDAADWLHWRRTLDGWGYSPLDEINRDNAHQLQLVWSIALRPGLSQPAPLVRAGRMYIPNPLGYGAGCGRGHRRPALGVSQDVRGQSRRHVPAAAPARWPSTATRFT